MKLKYLAVAVAAAFSFGANAGGEMKNKQSDAAPLNTEKSSDRSAAAGASTAGKAQTPASAGSANAETLKQAQTKLNVPADGKAGPQTQKALKEFQTSKGLEASGKLDQQTIAALGIGESASAGGSAPARTESRSAEPRSDSPAAGSSVTEQKPEQVPAPAAKPESSKQQ